MIPIMVEVQILIYESALEEMRKRQFRLRDRMNNLEAEAEELREDMLRMQRSIDAAREKYLKGVV